MAGVLGFEATFPKPPIINSSCRLSGCAFDLKWNCSLLSALIFLLIAITQISKNSRSFCHLRNAVLYLIVL